MKNKQTKTRVQKSNFNKQLLKFIDEYKATTGKKTVSHLQAAAWAISTGRYVAPPADACKALARLMSKAAREDYIDDEDGNPVRRRHAYTIEHGDQQLRLWVNMEDATNGQMKICFQQRRRSILRDNEQLDRDCKYYNKHHNNGKQLVIDFDYTKDMHEKDESGEYNDMPPEDEETVDPMKPR